ncbi:MAG: hypothetical protein IJ840_03975, partial [Bacteroidales bacterium]|nr:hypothetical protein [Bacteroidales bacterium]
RRLLTIALLLTLCHTLLAQDPAYTQTVTGKTTTVTILQTSSDAKIDPMIYGQMLEDCNDAVVYGGVVDDKGNENPQVIEQLKPLRIPVMRWPAGTAIYDYEWKKGVGPKEKREAVDELIWGGKEYYTFGTDEFIQWCEKIGAEPYINISMGNNSLIPASLGEAVDWVEYANGPASSQMGAWRAANGHPEPYNVRYWCIGNENYLTAKDIHKKESAGEYADLLILWAKTLKTVCPDLSLLGVGFTAPWNTIVLDKCGDQLDYLTIHYYMSAQIKDDGLVDPWKTLFSPSRFEQSLKVNIDVLKAYNEKRGRKDNPLRYSIDEWNNRHSVFSEGKYSFTRKDDRRQYDVAGTAGMLNVFLRNSPYVGMANYIFPVNGHGLLKTAGNEDAYKSTNYHVFDLYRKYMSGNTLSVDVTGPGMKGARLGDLRIDGEHDMDPETLLDLCFVDCAASIAKDGSINVALVNRSYDKAQKVKVVLPSGFKLSEAVGLQSDDVKAANTLLNRDNVRPEQIKTKADTVTLKPCGLVILKFLPEQ